MNLQQEARKRVAAGALLDKTLLPNLFMGTAQIEDIADELQAILANDKKPDFSKEDEKNLLKLYPGAFKGLTRDDAVHGAWYELTNDTFAEMIEMLDERLRGSLNPAELRKLQEEVKKIGHHKELTPAEAAILEEEATAAWDKEDRLGFQAIRQEIDRGHSLDLIRELRKFVDFMNGGIRPLVREWAGPASPSMSGPDPAEEGPELSGRKKTQKTPEQKEKFLTIWKNAELVDNAAQHLYIEGQRVSITNVYHTIKGPLRLPGHYDFDYGDAIREVLHDAGWVNKEVVPGVLDWSPPRGS